MSTQIKHRRGNQAEIDAFTPAIAEFVVNTDTVEIVVGDGVTQGGIVVPRKDRIRVVPHLTLADAVADDSLNPLGGEVVSLKERSTGKGGGALWDTVLSSTVTENPYNIVQCTGVGTLSLVLRLNAVIKSDQWGVPTDGSNASPAAQFFLDYAATNNSVISYPRFTPGTYTLEDQLTIEIATLAIIGEYDDRRQSGSARSSVTFLWTGGATSMMRCNKADCTFAGFNVENRGTATDWLELTVGSQKHVFERLYFILATGATAFSRSVIYSDGARLGYSQFKHIIATSPADKFVYIKDGGSTGLTPITFSERCIFRATAGSFTIVDVENSVCEGLSFKDNTFIATSDEIVIVDTTTNPATAPLLTLEVNNCEFDADSGTVIATDRFFKLENVNNIRMDGNQINAGGGGNDFATLVNSQVTSFQGNYVKSLDFVFEADNDSIIRGVGLNVANWSNISGINDNPNCSFTALTQGTVVTLDGIDWGPAEPAQFVLDVTAASAYTFALDISKPQNWEPGQVFYLTIKNTSGGVADAPLFSGGTFNTQSTVFTAPANGKQKTLAFRFNGTEAQQISNESPDVNN